MIIMYRLLAIGLFILIVVGLSFVAKKAFNKIDEIEVKETKDDISHKADLTEDVDNYKSFNKTKIEKAQSNSVDEFNKTV